jgi:CO/xanthine dehydrogenase Mo-binding subunit
MAARHAGGPGGPADEATGEAGPTRAQMFTSVGHRPNTLQEVALGATRDGQLTAMEHVSKSSIDMAEELINLITHGTPEAYAFPNVATRATQFA